MRRHDKEPNKPHKVAILGKQTPPSSQSLRGLDIKTSERRNEGTNFGQLLFPVSTFLEGQIAGHLRVPRPVLQVEDTHGMVY